MKKSKKIILFLLTLSLILTLVACGDSSESGKEDVVEEDVVETEDNLEETIEDEDEETEEVKEEVTEPEEKEIKEDVPREHKAALKKADVYANSMHMSKKAVYDQLISEYGEGFPEEAAQYAVDNLESDWNYNALQKAKTYADDMNMSDSAIYDQLISEYGEQFTPEQAQYAVDNLE